LATILSSKSAEELDVEVIKYNLLEQKSIMLQGKLSGVLRAVEFDECSSNKNLISAIKYFKSHEILRHKAPREFLKKEESIILQAMVKNTI